MQQSLAQVRLNLHQRLRQLEEDQERLGVEIREFQHRLSLLDEVASWGIDEAADVVPEYQVPNGDARLLVLPLADAIVRLKLETPEITKQQVRERLESIGFRITDNRANVGRAVHAGWIAAERRLAAE